ncbi:hypothetical protein TTHERM_001322661 (macronuclear) [Tetrahymena thermophila SB210]|uniref:Uncharacterized protein n=1 Tax=Tetrahymena thermophila (strain SB210) TaxID=312017 RepID=W7XI69_TETTS|nr:hypothetical protein TTHERM_001322661 [Tetrahymena thermophila SB210]EWS74361.1 hypothetical protein TTHERM_001322661 [Tetrahymena thermophila SB210]|eukprot:XP_012653104.1 hypothetical protein TTHERM_001322661 [Tetrahymena thermophila SB210]
MVKFGEIDILKLIIINNVINTKKILRKFYFIIHFYTQ